VIACSREVVDGYRLYILEEYKHHVHSQILLRKLVIQLTSCPEYGYYLPREELKGKEKYDWEEDPIKEGAETEVPFSADVLTNLMYEVMARLSIIGDAVSGRFKVNAKV
jgi:hypothetical protein